MKKSTLWCVAICAGAVLFIAGAILVVMYGRDVYSYTSSKISNMRSAKDKALAQFLSKSYQAEDAQ